MPKMKRPKKKMDRQQIRAELEKQLIAFLDLRSKYPRDAEQFRNTAGDKEVEMYYFGMASLEGVAQKYGYVIDYWYDPDQGKWKYSIAEDPKPCPSAILK